MKKKLSLFLLSALSALNMSASVDVPYSETFDTEDAFNTFLVVNTNGDFYKWKFDKSKKAAYMPYTQKDPGHDDWLVTPEINLEAGVQYILKFYTSTGYGVDIINERLSVSFGQGDDPTLFSTVMPTKELVPSNRKYEEQTVLVTAPNTGTYRFGFHCTSQAWSEGLYLDDISVVADTRKAAPDAVSNLMVIPDPTGALKVSGSFTTPTKTTDGSELSSLDYVLVFRNGAELVDSITPVDLETSYKFTDDNVPADGNYEYSVIAYNEAGAGNAAVMSVYVGQDKPQNPTNVQIKDNFNGTLTISWTAPGNKGENGYYVNTDELKYIIYDVNEDGFPIPRDTVATTSTTVTINNTGEQHWVYFGLAALTSAGKSKGVETPIYIAGDPLQMPFIESFPNASTEAVYWYSTVGGFSLDNISSDDNNGSAVFTANSIGQVADLNTGKVTLRGSSNPKLTFKYYAIPGKDAMLKVVINNSFKELVTAATYSFKDMAGEEGWRQAVIDLNPYNNADDQYVITRFIASSNEEGSSVRFDEVNIHDMLEYNLAVSLDAPQKIMVGNPTPINVVVKNTGDNAAENFIVNLYADNQLVDSQSVVSLKSLGDTIIGFSYAPNAAVANTVTLKAEVIYDLDFDEIDNTAIANVGVVQNDFSTAINVTAIADDDNVVVTWDAPRSTVHTVTEDFESYDSFISDNFGEWTCVDVDQQPTNSIAELNLPLDGEPMAFYSWNPASLGINLEYASNKTLKPHSGNQCLVCWGNDVSAVSKFNDDWLISPELSGEEQTVSFYAKAMADFGSNQFEILYSMSGKEVSDFTSKVGSTNMASDIEWSYYKAKLPQGAKFFAIHVISDDAYALMIDDITYQATSMDIIGYNIYRDGSQVGTTMSDQTTYTDKNVVNGEHTYQVSVIYEEGESPLSDGAVVLLNGIDDVMAAGSDGWIHVSGNILSIVADGQEVGVYTLNGMLVENGMNSVSIALQPGIYLAKAGNKSVRIIVR